MSAGQFHSGVFQNENVSEDSFAPAWLLMQGHDGFNRNNQTLEAMEGVWYHYFAMLCDAEVSSNNI